MPLYLCSYIVQSLCVIAPEHRVETETVSDSPEGVVPLSSEYVKSRLTFSDDLWCESDPCSLQRAELLTNPLLSIELDSGMSPDHLP